MVVLAALTQAARHGHEVKAVHDEWLPWQPPLAFGQVYAALSRLQAGGWIESVRTETAAGPERIVYAATSAGRERVASWWQQPGDPSVRGGDVLVKVVVAANSGFDPTAMLHRHRAACQERLRVLEQAAVSSEPGVWLFVAHAEEHVHAELRWVDKALQSAQEWRTTRKTEALSPGLS